ncbi:L-dopachrome tautomerase-related protein [Franconibacter helveticus]|uniref:L-dopachrome tautomerase-related protein n=1 Tax=Franconibacter helveticus TaxID=357240 RepID=UPI00066C8705|nr:L-dopachrome tautomerase-related protein [Franconibacter helveticus]
MRNIRSSRRALALAVALAFAGTLFTSAAAQAQPLTLAELASDRVIGQPEVVATFNGAMPTGVTVTEAGRIFVNFPRWGDDVPFTVAEVKGNQLVAYPNPEINKADNARPGERFLSVQSVVADGLGRLWVLDTAAPGFSKPVTGGAKLVAIDLKTNNVVKTLVFPPDVILDATYVNDMRFDFRVGKAGVAYVTDSSLSGTGGIIVMDLATGKATRRLTGDRSTSPEPGFVPVVEGETLLQRHEDGSTAPFSVASDGIALSPDGKTLYYSPLSGRHLYAVSTELLRDPGVSEAQLAAAVKDAGEKGASDGLEADANGAVYAGDYERNSIRKREPNGEWRTLAHGPQILWPDTLSVGPDGYLYFTVNQLNRQPGFHGGKDLRQKPYALLRVRINAAPAPTH